MSQTCHNLNYCTSYSNLQWAFLSFCDRTHKLNCADRKWETKLENNENASSCKQKGKWLLIWEQEDSIGYYQGIFLVYQKHYCFLPSLNKMLVSQILTLTDHMSISLWEYIMRNRPVHKLAQKSFASPVKTSSVSNTIPENIYS